MKLLFFFYLPMVNSEGRNLGNDLDVFYTHAQRSAQIKVCFTKRHVLIVSH